MRDHHTIGSLTEASDVHSILKTNIIEHAKENQSNLYDKALVDYLSGVAKAVLDTMTSHVSDTDKVARVNDVLLHTPGNEKGEQIVKNAIFSAVRRSELIETLTARGDRKNIFPEVTSLMLKKKLSSLFYRKVDKIAEQRKIENSEKLSYLIYLAEQAGFASDAKDEAESLKKIQELINQTPDEFADVVTEVLEEANRTK